MEIRIGAEYEEMLCSFIHAEKWVKCPKEALFYLRLNLCLEYSGQEYKPMIQNLIDLLKIYDFVDIKTYVNTLITQIKNGRVVD